ncbi:hypothetical protein [Fulvivirga sedimenti]|uniref:Uncharacterized protein n=1 Tax=Fulvivirga sedimenti TaxID=2879465 RepID=A0A9X1HND0_9BACT|nr:hypothetical protein [Fulvivirga sedimenti]MCA6073988.1 hypothetical protein [Fulvivirga sedimenti]
MKEQMKYPEIQYLIGKVRGYVFMIFIYILYAIYNYGYVNTYGWLLCVTVLIIIGLAVFHKSLKEALQGIYVDSSLRAFVHSVFLILPLGILCFYLFFYKGIYEGYLMIKEDFSFKSLVWRLFILTYSYFLTVEVADLFGLYKGLEKTNELYSKEE